MHTITILFFATLREIAGGKQIELAIEPGLDVAGLKAKLSEQFPKMEPALRSVLVSVNKEYAFDQETIPLDAEVALFPPVSGG
jgi:molybdopterin converting factor subunit 1